MPLRTGSKAGFGEDGIGVESGLQVDGGGVGKALPLPERTDALDDLQGELVEPWHIHAYASMSVGGN